MYKKIIISTFFIILIFIIALIIRIYAIIFIEPNFSGGDTLSYDTLALSILKGEGFSINNIPTSTRAPLYPYFLAGIYFIFGHNYLVARIIQCVLSAIICVIIYLMANEIFNKKVAITAAIFSIFYIPFIISPSYLMRETLFMFLFIISVFVLIKAIDKKIIILYPFSGILFALSALIKEDIVIFPLFLLVFFFAIKKLKIYFNNFSIFLLFFILTILPWTIRNYIVHKKFVPISTRSGITLYNSYFYAEYPGFEYDGFSFLSTKSIDKEYHELKSEVDKDRFLLKKALNFISENPNKFLMLIPVKIGLLFYPFDGKWYNINLGSKYNILFGVIFIFAIVGAIFSLKNTQALLLLFIILHTITVSSIFYGCPRFRLPIEPYLIILASFGIIHLFNKMKVSYYIILALIFISNILLFLQADNIALFLRNFMQTIATFLPKG